MKTVPIVVLSGLLLCGCSQKQASGSGPAIDRIQVGDTTWHNGSTVCTVHVTKRDGTSLEGVSISGKTPTGQMMTVSGDTATLSAVPNAADDKSVLITVHNGKLQIDSQSSVLGEDYPMVFHE